MAIPVLLPRAATRLLPPLAALAATLALGMLGPAIPGWWHWLQAGPLFGLLGPVLALSAGLLAYTLAQATVARRHDPLVTALPAALVAASLPGLGVPALLAPLMLASLIGVRAPERSRTGLAGQCATGTALAAAALDSPMLGSFAGLAMLATAAWLVRGWAPRAANDNRAPDRFQDYSWLPVEPTYASTAPRVRPASEGN